MPSSPHHARLLLAALALGGCWDEVVGVGSVPCGDGGCACADSDGDGVCDGRDVCPGDDRADTDGDGVCDSLDACLGDDRADADLDGVCDAADVCTGADDRLDVDGDGLRDCMDPCRYDGPTPLELWSLPLIGAGRGLDITLAELTGSTRIVRARPGDVVPVRVGFTAEDCECPTCVWQIRIGLADEPGPQSCVWAGIPGCPGLSRTVVGSVRLPPTAGEHGLRVDRSRDTVCTLGAWEEGTRRPDELAMICSE